MSSQIQQQISKLQSQADKAKNDKKSLKLPAVKGAQKNEKANSQRRRSRSRTPKGGHLSKTAMAHHREIKFKDVGGTLDIARARLAMIKPMIEKKKQLGDRIESAIKENMFLSCAHKFAPGYDKNAAYAKCLTCNQQVSLYMGKADEKAAMVKDTSDMQSLYDMICKEFDMARTAMRTALGTKPLRIDLWLEGSNTSSATSTQAPVQRCRPSDSAEFSSLASLFDEYTMTGAENVFKMYQSTGTAGGVDGGVAYDPLDATAYGSLITLLPAAQKLAPIATGAIGATAPQSMNPTGHFHLQIHCPRGPQMAVAGVGSPTATGTWQDCTTTTADWGYFKYFVTAPSSGTSSLSWHVKMECLFRSRT